MRHGTTRWRTVIVSVLALAPLGAYALPAGEPAASAPAPARPAVTVAVSPHEQLALVRRFLAEALGRAPQDIELEANAPLTPLRLPLEGAAGLRVEWDGARGLRPGGAVRLRLVLRRAGSVVVSRSLALRARIFAPALALAHPVRTGEPIGPEDVVLQRVEWTALSAMPRDALGRAGLLAARPLQAGEVLTERNSRPAPLVAQGAIVSLVARRAGLELRTRGQALTAGREGEVIRVRNLSSRRIVEARVVGPDQVEAVIP